MRLGTSALDKYHPLRLGFGPQRPAWPVRAVRSLRGVVRRLTASMSWAEFQRYFVTIAGGEGQISQPMAQSTWVYVAVSANARAVAGLKWKLLDVNNADSEITSGPGFDLISRPAADATDEDLFEEIVGHLCEGGEAHIFDGDTENMRSGAIIPKELMVVGKRQMTPLYDQNSGELVHWEYRPAWGNWKNVPIHPDQHAYMRLFNPYDAYRGLSPLEASSLGISQDYRAARFNEAALRQGGAPGGLVVFPDRVSEEEGKEYLKRWEDRHGGEGSANKLGVIGGGVTYQQTAFSNIDLALLDGRKMNREEIFAAIGVPPVVGFVFDSAHYQIGDAAQEVWIHGTIEPIVRKVMGLFNVILLPRIQPGVKLVIDVNSHHVIQRIEQGKLETLNKSIRSGVPYNEAKDLLNLRLEDQPWGTQSFLEGGLETPQNITEGISPFPVSEEPEEEEEEEEATERRSDEATKGQGSGIGDQGLSWSAGLREEKKAEERQTAKQIPGVRRKYRAFFIRQHREIVKRLGRVLKDQVSIPESLNPSIPLRTAERTEEESERIAKRVLLRLTSEQAKLRKLVTDYFPRSVEQTLRAELKRLKVSDDAIERAVKQLKGGKYLARILKAKQSSNIQIEATTRRRVNRALVEGLKRGETIGELSERIRTGIQGMDAKRALRIARTEAGEAVSMGRFVAATAAGAQGKGWIHGRNPRPTHAKAARDYNPRTSAIPMDEYFRVGADRLMYPRDPSGSPGEIINCNCIMVTVRLKKGNEATRQPGNELQMVNAISFGNDRAEPTRRAA